MGYDRRVSDEVLERYFQLGTMTDKEIGQLTGYKANSIAAIRRKMGYLPGALYSARDRITGDRKIMLKDYGEEWEKVTRELKAKYGDRLKQIIIVRETAGGTDYPKES